MKKELYHVQEAQTYWLTHEVEAVSHLDALRQVQRGASNPIDGNSGDSLPINHWRVARKGPPYEGTITFKEALQKERKERVT